MTSRSNPLRKILDLAAAGSAIDPRDVNDLATPSTSLTANAYRAEVNAAVKEAQRLRGLGCNQLARQHAAAMTEQLGGHLTETAPEPRTDTRGKTPDEIADLIPRNIY